MEQQAVYRQTAAYAREAGELALYRESNKLNTACKEAIEQAFHEGYANNHLDTSFVQDIVNQHGADRVEWVLANTLRHKDYDGRFSRSSMEWAKTVPMPEDKSFTDRSVYYVVETHPAILEGAMKDFRRAIDAARELPPIYRESANYAMDAGETEQYGQSRKLNIACKEAIEQAIDKHYSYETYCLDTGFVPEIMEQFGADRVEWVLANTVQQKSSDGRFSSSNKEWAQAVSIPEDKDYGINRRFDFVIDKSHPGLVDIAIRAFRKAIDAAREQPERKPSIKEQLAAPPVHGEKPRTPGRDKGAR